MTTATLSFNLLEKPWLPVIDDNGRKKSLSLLDLVVQADTLKEVSHPDPLVTIATYRFVLAFLHRALDGPKSLAEVAQWYKEGFPREKIAAYAKRWDDRFDLFHAKFPFFQNPGLRGYENKKGKAFEASHWSKLDPVRAGSNANPLFNPVKRDKNSEFEDTGSPSSFALYLLAHQNFALGGLVKKFRSSGKQSPAAVACLTLVQGSSLLETLCLNLVLYDEKHNAKNDLPCWERGPETIQDLEQETLRPIAGLAECYTWQARSLLAQDTAKDEVSSCIYAEGLDPGVNIYPDPMTGKRLSKAGNDYYARFSEDKGLWRDLHSFHPDSEQAPANIEHARDLRGRLRDLRPLYFSCFGLVNNQAKIKMVRQEHLRLPPLALEEGEFYTFLESWIDCADQQASSLRKALNTLAQCLLSTNRGGPAPADIKSQVSSFQWAQRFWPQAESLFWRHIDSLPRDWDDFEDQSEEWNEQWQKAMRRLKYRVFDDIQRSLNLDAKTIRAVETARRVLRKEKK